ncbi:MAG: alpha/beta hydrolase [Armatimonadetes bacterium]|nr:alpha/beta hydrolase [Armatimonadota bacterium]
MVVLPDQRFPVEGGAAAFDLFRPAGDGPFPLVVFVHGGGWISGDRTDYREEALWLAPHGYACACIDYRLAPLYPYPTPIADCQRFFSFAAQNAASLGIDTDDMTVFGNSAGGHLALMCGLCESVAGSGEPAVRPQSVVAVCAISDLRVPEQSNLPLSFTFLEQFMDGGYEGREEQWAAASPVCHLEHARGRFLIVHGTEDDVVPVDQSRSLVQRLTGLGTDVEFVELQGESHSFSWDGWSTIRSEALEFLKQGRSVRSR